MRYNTHMSHLESLVTYGKEALNEIQYKLDNFLNDDINVNLKYDGCLAPETLVCTTEGNIPFSKIINDYLCLNKIYTGYGIDDTTNEIKQIKLDMPRQAIGLKDWVCVEFDNNDYIVATEDHPFRVNGNYIAAKDLITEEIDGYNQIL